MKAEGRRQEAEGKRQKAKVLGEVNVPNRQRLKHYPQLTNH